jgi:hypothetical protein
MVSSSNLSDLIAILRHGSESDAAAALNRIRQAENIDAAVNTLAVDQALTTPRLATSSTENLHSNNQRPQIAARARGHGGPRDRLITSPYVQYHFNRKPDF